MINVNNEELKGRVVLVGPTGVGKTTTIAKLAGKLALLEKKESGAYNNRYIQNRCCRTAQNICRHNEYTF